jgi:exonuclease SbcD
MDAAGACTYRAIELTPRREVRRIEGLMRELLKAPAAGTSAEDYLEVTLLDAGPVVDAMGRLRAVYPNVLCLGEPKISRNLSPAAADARQFRALDETALFDAFYSHTSGNEMSGQQRAAYVSVVEEMHRYERAL